MCTWHFFALWLLCNRIRLRTVCARCTSASSFIFACARMHETTECKHLRNYISTKTKKGNEERTKYQLFRQNCVGNGQYDYRKIVSWDHMFKLTNGEIHNWAWEGIEKNAHGGDHGCWRWKSAKRRNQSSWMINARVDAAAGGGFSVSIHVHCKPICLFHYRLS